MGIGLSYVDECDSRLYTGLGGMHAEEAGGS